MTQTNYTRVEYNIATGQVSGATSVLGPAKDVIRRVGRNTDDLRGLYNKIADDFYKTNEKLVFSDTGVKFPDLSDKTKYNKAMAFGDVYPILVGETGDLRESLTNRFSRNAVVDIKKRSLRIQSRVPYSGFHQDGTKYKDGSTLMPKRPPIDLSDPVRNLRWANMAADWSIRNLGVPV